MRDQVLEIMARELGNLGLLESDRFSELGLDMVDENIIRDAIERELGIVVYDYNGFTTSETIGEYIDMVMTYM